MDINFCKSLPKLELHAHLNGSLSEKTLRELHTSQESIDDFLKLNKVLDLGPSRTLEECFELFKVAHIATNNPSAVFSATQDVISEFSNDGVIYLELRTTPRLEPNMTKQQYINAVIEGIELSRENNPTIEVKLILSLDRKRPIEEATDTVDLAINYRKSHPHIVIGVDVSGNPTIGSWFKPLLTKIRKESDLKLTVHCAEVPNVSEIKDILEFKPDRIGHGTCIHPEYNGSEETWHLLLDKKIPVECCLTSNVKCKTTKSYEEHHLKFLLAAQHPYVIATDDKGVFATSLAEEFKLAADTFGLTKADLWSISYNTIDYTFCTDDEKNRLKEILTLWNKENL